MIYKRELERWATIAMFVLDATIVFACMFLYSYMIDNTYDNFMLCIGVQ